MKKIVFVPTFLLFTLNSFSQSPTLSKDYYLTKSKNKRTAGWVMLIGGAAMTTIGFTSFYKQINADETGSSGSSNDSGADFEFNLGPAFLTLVGIGTTLGSIPFFINAGKNKRRALSVAINNQKIFVPLEEGYVLKRQPALTLKLAL